ncbi:hypothetical protein BGZ63DRAFT_366340 [Mariannaea sp. PMI_226]|nr:hypothetical protein BGZ63DRAFT_366340 [Mariannaea sp. PMI_226]
MLRRLNGRPQACDQCRARKVACDHRQPTCNHCVRRNQTCVYTVTPKPKPSLPTAPAPASPSRPSRPRPLSRSKRRDQQAPRSRTSSAASTPTPPCSGYLGFTSHSTVFEETRNSLTLANGALDVESSPKRHRGRGQLSELPPELRDMSMFVLKNLPGPNDALEFENTPCRSDGWIHLAVRRIVRTLYSSYGSYINHGRGGGDDDNDNDSDNYNDNDNDNNGYDDGDTLLDECARIISANTARPFREQKIDDQAWLDQFTGEALRWESIGLIWTFWDSGNLNNIGLALKYCIDLALHLSSGGNDIILYLCYRRCTMESIITGDAGLSCWRCHGEAVAMMTFLGAHAESDSPDYRPTLVTEHRRRIFSQIFNLDKVVVSFTGRPMLIHSRYSSTPLPLDLAEHDLFAGGEALARAVDALDENGWSTSGLLGPCTLLRARMMNALLREELLDIALGTKRNGTLEQLQDIQRRQLHMVSQFPPSLAFRPDDLAAPDADVDRLCKTVLLRLEHLQNLFFVQRLMLQFGGPDNGQLLVTSFEMVSLTVYHWTHQDRFASVRRDFEWLLMGYAAPGGGILCLELLRPTLHGAHPDHPKVSRSGIIQQLSLLVGFLDWVQPSAPNADLCADCKAVIQGVLDHSLNNVAGTLDWESLQVDFDFNLLDTYDWMHPES